MDKLPVELIYDILDKASNPNLCNLNKTTYDYCIKKCLYEKIVIKTLSKTKNSWNLLKNNKYFLHVVKKEKYKDFLIKLILKSKEPVDFFQDLDISKIFIKEKSILDVMESGNLSIFKYYIDKGIKVTTDSYTYSYTDINKKFLEEDPLNLLGLASYFKQIDMIDYLLKKGFNIHANKESALRASLNNPKILKFLLSKGADISFNNRQLLTEAIRINDVKTLKILFDNGIKM